MMQNPLLRGMSFVCALFVTVIVQAASGATPQFPGDATDWHGFDRYQFEVGGKLASVVVPEQVAEGRPWVWHGEFFGHKPAPDIELLKRGFHIVYLRVPDLLGAPKAVGHWNDLYRELTGKYQLNKKPGLVGLSRGGLYCYNWAIANPDQVACIYADAPVCDFKSWPGGKGSGPGSPRDWALVLNEYGFADEAAAIAYDKNPVDQLAPLAARKVPLLHVYGDADEVVPWEENTGLIAERYRKLGGPIQLIVKPGVKHHPHGLEDSTPIVEFFVKHCSDQKTPQTTAKPAKKLDPVDQIAITLTPSRIVEYKQVGDRKLQLHIFEPEGFQTEDERPCFVIIHGGGWTGGQPRRMYPFAEHFARLGCVGISVQYRLHKHSEGGTVFDCVKDGRSAIRYIRAHAAELGIDPQKIIVSGGSAGGHVAVATALFTEVNEEGESTEVDCMPNALVLLFPVIDTSKEGYGQAKIGDRWQELSPVHHVRSGLPPTITFHGTGDTVTPFAGAEAFHQKMLQAGNHSELVINEGGRHGYLMYNRDLLLETLQKTEKFLRAQQMLE